MRRQPFIRGLLFCCLESVHGSCGYAELRRWYPWFHVPWLSVCSDGPLIVLFSSVSCDVLALNGR